MVQAGSSTVLPRRVSLSGDPKTPPKSDTSLTADVFQSEPPEAAPKRPDFPNSGPFMTVGGSIATAGAVGLLTGLATSGLPWAAPIAAYITGASVGTPIGAEIGSRLSSEYSSPYLGGSVGNILVGTSAAILASSFSGNTGLGLAVAGATSAVTLGALLLWRCLDSRSSD